MITNKLIAEFMGTLFFVMTALLVDGAAAAAAVLTVVIYSLGHISGGHFNPAVSLAVFLRGRMSKKELVEYAIAQTVAAVVAVLIYKFLHDYRAAVPKVFEEMERLVSQAAKTEAARVPFVRALIGEFLFTFLLVFTVLQVSTTRALAGNTFYGAAVGLCFYGGITVISRLSGGALNPALGLALVASGHYEVGTFFVYALGCFGGAVVAAIVFRIMLPHEHAPAVTAGQPRQTPPPLG